jgi:hypothetical protein
LQESPSGAGKIAVVIGGFLIIIGMILLGIFFLAMFGTLGTDLLIDENFAKAFMLVFLIIGVIDMVSGLMLWRR